MKKRKISKEEMEVVLNYVLLFFALALALYEALGKQNPFMLWALGFAAGFLFLAFPRSLVGAIEK